MMLRFPSTRTSTAYVPCCSKSPGHTAPPTAFFGNSWNIRGGNSQQRCFVEETKEKVKAWGPSLGVSSREQRREKKNTRAEGSNASQLKDSTPSETSWASFANPQLKTEHVTRRGNRKKQRRPHHKKHPKTTKPASIPRAGWSQHSTCIMTGNRSLSIAMLAPSDGFPPLSLLAVINMFAPAAWFTSERSLRRGMPRRGGSGKQHEFVWLAFDLQTSRVYGFRLCSPKTIHFEPAAHLHAAKSIHSRSWRHCFCGELPHLMCVCSQHFIDISVWGRWKETCTAQTTGMIVLWHRSRATGNETMPNASVPSHVYLPRSLCPVSLLVG